MRKPRIIILLATVFVLTAGLARAAAPIETVVAFNPAAGQFPEGVAVDVTGNAYVSLISPVAQIRKIDRNGGQSVLAQFGAAGFGPLGMALNSAGDLYVRIAVQPDGSAGAASVVAQGSALFGADGVALDVFGDAFVAVNSQNTLIRVAPDGGITTLATAADGLQNPASVAFATSHGERKTLYLTNFAVFSAAPKPALLRTGVGV